jgi:ribosomal protein S13
VTQVANVNGIGSFIAALESARAGVARGMRGLAADAQTIAHANVDKENQVSDLSDALVQSIVDRIQVQASARMMRTVDETLGTLIDTKA